MWAATALARNPHPRCDKTHKGLVSILSDTVFPEVEGRGILWHAFVSTLFAGKTFFFSLFSLFFLRNSRMAFTGNSRSKSSRLSVLFDLVIATKPNKYLLRTSRSFAIAHPTLDDRYFSRGREGLLWFAVAYGTRRSRWPGRKGERRRGRKRVR